MTRKPDPAPRPSKQPPRPSKQPPRPSKQPPRPSKRPAAQGATTPTIPRAPRLPEAPRADHHPRGRDERRRPPPGPLPGPPRAPPQPRVAPPPVETAPTRRISLPLVTEVSASDPLGEPEFLDYEWNPTSVLSTVAHARVGNAPRAMACDAGSLSLRRGDAVVLESERGIELAIVTAPPQRQLLQYRLGVRVLRRASEGDLKSEARTRLREAEAFRTAVDVLRGLKLPVKVVRVECSMTGARTVVHLASEERIELRDAARMLTTALRGRVELRQTGVRDAARVVGGVGPCGLQLCCNTFLADFAPVSIRHAKDQGLALHPQRVSGVCGRLMCCLVYEDAFYRQQRALFPKQGKRVVTPKGEGRVRDVDVLARTVRVALGDGPTETFSVDEVRALHAAQGAQAADDTRDE